MIAIPFGTLHKAAFLGRPNRFLLRCALEESGEEVEVHLADPGRLRELLFPGAPVWLRRSDNPRRRTQWSAVLGQDPHTKNLVSLQSVLVNDLVHRALAQGALDEFGQWPLLRSEYTRASSRWDFLLGSPQGKQLLLEVKSVTLVEDQVALFPDAVTARGRRHVLELASLQQLGEFETAVLFVAQRSDALRFAPQEAIDPAFSEALRFAFNQGVKVYARSCQVSLEKIVLGHPLPVCLTKEGEYDTGCVSPD
ncbi:MAG: DNA/RNA nuclease SfsA [Limnochordia bacterium]|jgi:sugar fermentation stimulation protein A|nr:MAG: hypothetical protein AA931_01520 [Peptococcaceae bacterium 1109]